MSRQAASQNHTSELVVRRPLGMRFPMTGAKARTRRARDDVIARSTMRFAQWFISTHVEIESGGCRDFLLTTFQRCGVSLAAQPGAY